MNNWSKIDTEVPKGLQIVLFTLVGAGLGLLGAATLAAATAGSMIALSIYPCFLIAALIGGVVGLFLGIKKIGE